MPGNLHMSAKHLGAADGHRTGDKVRVKVGPHSGARGLVLEAQGDVLTIDLGERRAVTARVAEVTNYSLAARRAWRSMPKRAGRPRAVDRRKRMVSLRIDSDVWRMLGAAAQMGLIPSREQAVNNWLKDGLQTVLDVAPSEVRERVQTGN